MHLFKIQYILLSLCSRLVLFALLQMCVRTILEAGKQDTQTFWPLSILLDIFNGWTNTYDLSTVLCSPKSTCLS